MEDPPFGLCSARSVATCLFTIQINPPSRAVTVATATPARTSISAGVHYTAYRMITTPDPPLPP